MFVTVYTDASSIEDEQFTWAFAAMSNSGRMGKYGACPDYITKINEAEFFAFLAAIHRIREAWPETERILICSDSRSALLWAKNHPPEQMLKQLRRQWKTTTTGVKIFTKKVKGHSSRKTIEGYMNHKVDRHARKAREAL